MTYGLQNNNHRAYLVGIIVIVTLFPTLVSAGEIYGRLSQGGKVMQGATVSMKCPSFSKSNDVKTDRTGVYRLAGPDVAEKCAIQVNGSNFVTVYSSTSRTRVNLEIVAGTLIRR